MKNNSPTEPGQTDTHTPVPADINTPGHTHQDMHTPESNKKQAEDHHKYGRFLAILECCFILIGLISIPLLIPHALHGDGTVRYQNITDFIQHGIVASASNRYSLIGPLFSLPLLYIGKKLGQPVAWILSYNYVLFVVSLLAVYLLCKDRLDRGLLRKFILLMVTSSMFAAHLSSYYGEIFTAVCVGFGVMAAMIRFTSAAGWIAIVLGVVNTPATLVGLGLMMAKKMLDSKRFRYVLVILAAVVLILGESWLRRGSIFVNGYDNDAGFHTFMPYSGLPGFSYPFYLGLLSILFSFGKGLIFFTPGLLLPIGKTLKSWRDKYAIDMYQVYSLWICFIIGLIVVYSRWWSWNGGLYWGPRFFLFASIPASFALAVRLQHKETHLAINILTVLVLSLSAWVGVCAVLFQSYTYVPTCMQHNYALETACLYIPDFSVLWRPFVVHPHLPLAGKLYLAYSLLVFLYFVLPLLFKIYQQTKNIIVAFVASRANLREWRI